MEQNMQRQTGTAHTGKSAHGDTRIKIVIKSGIETWFDVDDITIHVWGSMWTGREVITVWQGEQKRVVSSKRSWRFDTPRWQRSPLGRWGVRGGCASRPVTDGLIAQRATSRELSVIECAAVTNVDSGDELIS
ncbi:MAG: hypothetical protein FJ178_03185 [Gammaproteobacteria bacterium]|nr:hypothetical protein [Gammaproteobacteria bacterium]